MVRVGSCLNRASGQCGSSVLIKVIYNSSCGVGSLIKGQGVE